MKPHCDPNIYRPNVAHCHLCRFTHHDPEPGPRLVGYRVWLAWLFVPVILAVSVTNLAARCEPQKELR